MTRDFEFPEFDEISPPGSSGPCCRSRCDLPAVVAKAGIDRPDGVPARRPFCAEHGREVGWKGPRPEFLILDGRCLDCGKEFDISSGSWAVVENHDPPCWP